MAPRKREYVSSPAPGRHRGHDAIASMLLAAGARTVAVVDAIRAGC